MKELLIDRFSNKGLGNEAFKIIRDGGYIWTLGNIESAITQFGDLGTSAYQNGLWGTFVEYAKAWTGKSEITLQDIGIDKVIKDGEIKDTSSIAKLLDGVLKYNGFQKLDIVSKQTIMNSALRKARRLALKDDKELSEYLFKEFGEDYKNVLEDLKNNRLTPEIIEYAVFKLMDVQPLTIDQMPRYYARGGKTRMFYMLKSYFIKQLNEYRKITFEKMKTNPVGASKDLALLTFYLMIFNAGADLLKDLLMNREINVSDRFIDNLFVGGSINRYTAMNIKKDGPFRTFQEQLLFPIAFDTLIVDLLSKKEIEDYKTWSNVPLVGRPYYWYFGGGESKKRSKKKKDKW